LRGEIIADGKATSEIYDNNAWSGLFVGVTEADLDHALRAVQMRNGHEASSLHTLGCVYADLGRFGEARKTLVALLEQRNRGKAESIDYYIIGRIAEGLGLKDAARTAYKKLEKPVKKSPSSTYHLAQRRLERL
jgi:hypothetical protein